MHCQADSTHRGAMSLTHCPLCVGLAVLSALQFTAHGLMVWCLWEPAGARPLQPAAIHG